MTVAVLPFLSLTVIVYGSPGTITFPLDALLLLVPLTNVRAAASLVEPPLV